MVRAAFLFRIIVLSLLLCSCGGDKNKDKAAREEKKQKKKQQKREKLDAITNAPGFKKWTLPQVLNEISGIAYAGDNIVVCVQDELGGIFFYDLEASEVIRQIPFGEKGDYEAVALRGSDAYVLRSDGVIVRLTNIQNDEPEIEYIRLDVDRALDYESLCYDKERDALLIVSKEHDDKHPNKKVIFSISTATMKLSDEPVIEIDLSELGTNAKKSNNFNERLKPSDISIHPVSKDIYLTDAVNRQLVIIGQNGAVSERYKLPSSIFLQPEGLTFSPKGEMLICNDAGRAIDGGSIITATLESLASQKIE